VDVNTNLPKSLKNAEAVSAQGTYVALPHVWSNHYGSGMSYMCADPCDVNLSLMQVRL